MTKFAKKTFLMRVIILCTYKHRMIDTPCVGVQCNSAGPLKMAFREEGF